MEWNVERNMEWIVGTNKHANYVAMPTNYPLPP